MRGIFLTVGRGLAPATHSGMTQKPYRIYYVIFYLTHTE